MKIIQRIKYRPSINGYVGLIGIEQPRKTVQWIFGSVAAGFSQVELDLDKYHQRLKDELLQG